MKLEGCGIAWVLKDCLCTEEHRPSDWHMEWVVIATKCEVRFLTLLLRILTRPVAISGDQWVTPLHWVGAGQQPGNFDLVGWFPGFTQWKMQGIEGWAVNLWNQKWPGPKVLFTWACYSNPLEIRVEPSFSCWKLSRSANSRNLTPVCKLFRLWTRCGSPSNSWFGRLTSDLIPYGFCWVLFGKEQWVSSLQSQDFVSSLSNNVVTLSLVSKI